MGAITAAAAMGQVDFYDFSTQVPARPVRPAEPGSDRLSETNSIHESWPKQSGNRI